MAAVKPASNPGRKRRSVEAVDGRLGSLIRAARIERSMSQGALGAKIGLTFQQIQKYESGANRISVATLLLICQALGRRPVEFLDAIAAGVAAPSEIEEPSLADARGVHAMTRIRSDDVRKAMAALAKAIVVSETKAEGGRPSRRNAETDL